MYGFPVIRSIAFVVAASVIAASCSNSSEPLPTSSEQVVSTTAVATTTTEVPSETTEELVERLGGAVVRLDVAACDGQGVGAGFLIDEHHIVTVAHNIVGAELIAATTGDEIAIAEPVGMDVLRDIALLRTDIPMGDVYFDLEGSEPVVGQDLILLGFPLGLDLTVTRGIVSNADVELPEEPLLRFVQIDAAANPGNSGGPVVTADGDLIGILQSGFVGFEGLNFATKLTVVERLLDSWIGQSALSPVACDENEQGSAATEGATDSTEGVPSPVNSAPPRTTTTSVPIDSLSLAPQVSIKSAVWDPNSKIVKVVVGVRNPSDENSYREMFPMDGTWNILTSVSITPIGFECDGVLIWENMEDPIQGSIATDFDFVCTYDPQGEFESGLTVRGSATNYSGRTATATAEVLQ